MSKFRPKSILQLILIGFLVVFFPIALTVYQAFDTLNELSKKNQKHIEAAIQVTRNSGRVTKIVEDMERSLRQYQLLKSKKLLKIFHNHLDEIHLVLGQLERELPAKIRGAHFEPFKARILTLRGQMAEPGGDSHGLLKSIRLISDLSPLTEKIAGTSNAYADKMISDSWAIAKDFRNGLIIKCLIIVPITIILAIFFTLLIAKPFRQLHGAITKLGDGHFQQKFEVDGPRDLRGLGKRLNWLAKRLLELEEQKQSFLRHMSHELKTPLAAMKEGGELLADEIPGRLNKEQSEVVGIINKSIIYFQNVIENLLDYNLLRSQKALILDSVDIKDTIDEVLNTHTLTVQRKGLFIHCEGEKFSLLADKKKLVTAIDNLFSNAVSFSPENKCIKISWGRLGDRLTFSIKDEGPGVKQEESDDIFSPFYQGSARKDGPIKGSGIGLSLAKECIKAHRGVLRILKAKKGACFQFEMPLMQAAMTGDK